MPKKPQKKPIGLRREEVLKDEHHEEIRHLEGKPVQAILAHAEAELAQLEVGGINRAQAIAHGLDSDLDEETWDRLEAINHEGRARLGNLREKLAPLLETKEEKEFKRKQAIVLADMKDFNKMINRGKVRDLGRALMDISKEVRAFDTEYAGKSGEVFKLWKEAVHEYTIKLNEKGHSVSECFDFEGMSVDRVLGAYNDILPFVAREKGESVATSDMRLILRDLIGRYVAEEIRQKGAGGRYLDYEAMEPEAYKMLIDKAPAVFLQYFTTNENRQMIIEALNAVAKNLYEIDIFGMRNLGIGIDRQKLSPEAQLAFLKNDLMELRPELLAGRIESYGDDLKALEEKERRGLFDAYMKFSVPKPAFLMKALREGIFALDWLEEKTKNRIFGEFMVSGATLPEDIEFFRGVKLDPSFVRTMYKRFLAEGGQMKKIARLAEITGEKPEPKTFGTMWRSLTLMGDVETLVALTAKYGEYKFAKKDVEAGYAKLLKEGRLENLKSMLDMTNVPVPSKIVQDYFSRFLANGDTESYGKLQALTNLEASPEAIQAAYKNLVRDAEVDALEDLIKQTGVEPTLELSDVNRGYEYLMVQGRFDDIPRFRDIVKRAPTSDSLQAFFKNFILNGAYESLEKLMRVVEGRVARETAQAAYKEFASTLRIDRLETALLKLGIKPEFSKEFSAQVFKGLIRENLFDGIKKFREISGYEPDDALVQEGLRAMVERYFDTETFWRMQEATGIKASIEVVQEAYQIFLEALDCNTAELFLKKTGITPKFDAEVARNIYDQMLRNRATHLAGRLEKLVGSAPPKDLIELYTNRYLRDGRVDEALKLKKDFGLEVTPEEVQAVYGALARHGKVRELAEAKAKFGIEPKFMTEDILVGYQNLLRTYGTDRAVIFYAVVHVFPDELVETFLRKALRDGVQFEKLTPMIERTKIEDFVNGVYVEWINVAKRTPPADVIYRIRDIYTATGVKMRAEHASKFTGIVARHLVERVNPQTLSGELAKMGDRLGITIPIDALILGFASVDAKKLFALDTEEVTSNHWYKPLLRLRKIQAVGESDEHDPWKKEIGPLLTLANEKGLLDIDNPADVEAMLSFFKEFGAYFLPNLFSLYFDLKHASKVQDLTGESRAMLEEVLSKKLLDRLPNPEAIINELRKFGRALQTEVLEDKFPEKLETTLGLEFFRAISGGETQWGGGDVALTKETFAPWRRTLAKNPKEAELSDGYIEEVVEVERAKRGGGGTTETTDEVDENIQEKVNLVLENKELQTVFKKLQKVLIDGVMIRDDLKFFWEAERSAVLLYLHASLDKAKEKLDKVPPKARAGIEKNIATIEGNIARLQSVEVEKEDEAGMVAFMEQLLKLNIKELERVIHIISAYHLFTTASPAWKESMCNLIGAEAPNPEQIENLSNLLFDYIKEHYVHEDQKNHHTGHTPFSPELRKALEVMYQAGGDPAKHILTQTQKKLKEILPGGAVSAKKQEKIALVPARGLMRMFSGDIGDACFVSRRHEFARGDYPEITSVTMVTNRGEARERMAGSVLLIEAKTPTGEKVLVIRANNPRENLLSKVDTGSLVEKVIEYAIRVAKRRGMDMVAIPGDERGLSSTNRQKVADYYYPRLTGKIAIGLNRIPSTEFNNHRIWDRNGASPCRVVWSKDKEL